MDYNNLSGDELVKKAEYLENQGDIEQAIMCWQNLFQRKADPVLLWHCGRLAVKNKNWKQAEEKFLSAIALDSKLHVAYESLGLLYLDTLNLEYACIYLKKCLTIKKSAHVFSLLGVAQNRLGLITKARDSFRKSIKMDPDYEEAYYNLATTFSNTEYKKKLLLLQKAIQLDPNYSKAHRELGWLLRKHKDFLNAETHIKKAIELDESDGWAHIYLGNLLWTQENFSLAEKAFNKAVEIWPNQSTPYWCLAHFYEYQDRFQESKELYEKALLLDPDDIEANLRYGLFLIGMKESDKAKSLLKHANNLDPEDERVNKALDKLETS